MRLQSPSRAFLAVLMALCASSGVNAADADNFDIARLMQLFSQAPESEVAYTEKKYSSLLAEPVVSSGTLAYRRPDTVEKNMTAPRKERFRIIGEELIMVRNGLEKRFPLSSQPLLSALAASLRGVLAGDAALLRKYFLVILEGEELAWRLELVPFDDEIARYVERIVVSGRAGRIEQIDERDSSGDRSVLQVR